LNTQYPCAFPGKNGWKHPWIVRDRFVILLHQGAKKPAHGGLFGALPQ
jgi:hypothetical protein